MITASRMTIVVAAISSGDRFNFSDTTTNSTTTLADSVAFFAIVRSDARDGPFASPTTNGAACGSLAVASRT
jgi:hypothetical protein